MSRSATRRDRNAQPRRRSRSGERYAVTPSRPRRQTDGMIGRLHHVVIDSPTPRALAGFYSELLGLPVTFESSDWVVISRDTTSSGIAFQRAPDLVPPLWPEPGRPQQIHLDVMVDDVEAADERVRALGCRRLDDDDATRRVYADPSGHPFCLVPRPGWSPPIAGEQRG